MQIAADSHQLGLLPSPGPPVFGKRLTAAAGNRCGTGLAEAGPVEKKE